VVGLGFILVALAIPAFFVGCWYVPAILWQRFGNGGAAVGAIVMLILPAYLLLVVSQFALEQQVCFEQDTENGSDFCDSAGDGLVYFVGFVLSPLAIAATVLSFLKHRKKRMSPEI
jgi:Na+(H+)/acetate symporter ActP